MELTLDLVINAELIIEKVSGSYPSVDNCYQVKVTLSNGTSYINYYVPKPVYNMWVNLKPLINILNTNCLSGLIDIFNEYGDWKSAEAWNNASMEDAGPSL